MKNSLLCAAAAVFAACACLPNFTALTEGGKNQPASVLEANGKNQAASVLEEGEDQGSIIIYELDDERFQKLLEKMETDENRIVHNLNKNGAEESETDLLYQDPEEAYHQPLMIYELGDKRVPAADWSDAEGIACLKEQDAQEALEPSGYHNLEICSQRFCFSDIRECVFTDRFFDAAPNGYISIAAGGISGPVRISMLEYGSGRIVGAWEGDPQTVSGIRFLGEASKFYYFKLEPSGETSVSGSAEIFWDWEK